MKKEKKAWPKIFNNKIWQELQYAGGLWFISST